LAEEKESDFQKKLNLIIDAKNDVVLKNVTIEIDELELEY